MVISVDQFKTMSVYAQRPFLKVDILTVPNMKQFSVTFCTQTTMYVSDRAGLFYTWYRNHKWGTHLAHLIFATIRIPSLANDWFKATEIFPDRLMVTCVMFGVNAGNSKQGLRCKSCKMATHLWCSSELSQQPCNGKVRLFAPSSDCYTLRIDWMIAYNLSGSVWNTKI